MSWTIIRFTWLETKEEKYVNVFLSSAACFFFRSEEQLTASRDLILYFYDLSGDFMPI